MSGGGCSPLSRLCLLQFHLCQAAYLASTTYRATGTIEEPLLWGGRSGHVVSGVDLIVDADVGRTLRIGSLRCGCGVEDIPRWVRASCLHGTERQILGVTSILCVTIIRHLHYLQ